jgi:signal transduction histidine kinase
MRHHRRTVVAAILIGVAVLLPTAAWYVSGSRETKRRASALRNEAELRLQEEVEREAARLGARLEELRRQESNRPFFHYQTLYHDPRGAAQGLSVTPSPLASGSADQLVWAHFQIDEGGEVSLPAVSERFPELSGEDSFGAFCSLLAELQNAVVVDHNSLVGGLGTDDERVLTMTEHEWEQIVLADSVYESITGGREAPTDLTPVAGDVGRVVVRVRPLRWHTMVLGSGPALAALREVHTPSGVVLQGFAVAPAAVAQWLGASALHLEFSPWPDTPADAVAGLVANTGWSLLASSTDVLASAATEGRAVIVDFHRTFLLTVITVSLAAAAVIWILFQTDRLARQRAQFAAAAAHELKTPLSGLLLHSEMLAEELGDPQGRTRYASTITHEAERLSRVVTNMLDLSRLERGALLARPTRGDLGDAVNRCVERSRHRLEENGISIEVSIAPDLPMALFDDDALRQILDNLLDNAEKHTRTVRNRRVGISVEAKDDCVRIEVADNGPGIPRQQRRTLFRPFDRPATANGTPGLGLGLALARSLATAQGGRLELVTDDRPGAIFVLTLPTAER